ncbi:TPA: type 4b pilus protein PilO2 [Yersinia enterocolitica]|nr:type 4b pilus protein PilO2 [Yersinia enterocolitica]HDL6900940.1 type 4b pilus protein PilO2 [Yersinia enterocolitica]HDL7092046.1 type 4b pilus protein PilO2 [Yersinia enterocolitica]HDL7101085.1 type 4b pilus protein PilO2 [Yersinia enterocolitica]HDL7135568.1 type 4b pilus protein PilO2 [Yersinia enterocolitica]
MSLLKTVREYIENKNSKNNDDNSEVGEKKEKIGEKQSIQVVQVNGKKFVTGLFWQQIQDPRSYMAEARKFGKANGMDVVAIRHADINIQAGFVARKRGAEKGMYSLASTIAGIIETTETGHDGRWLGIFEIEEGSFVETLTLKNEKTSKTKLFKKNQQRKDDLDFNIEELPNEISEENIASPIAANEKKYLFVAVSDGSIVPSSDKVGNAQDMKRIASQAINLFSSSKKFKKIYSPPELGLGEYNKKLSDILVPKNLKKEYQLKQLTFGLTKQEILTYMIFLLLVCSAFAYYKYDENIKKQQIAEQNRIALEKYKAEQQRIKSATKKDVQIEELLKPWVGQPSVKEFVSNCTQLTKSIPPNILGWELTKINCTEKALSTDYTRNELSTVNDFRQSVKGLFNVDIFTTDNDGNTALFAIENKMLPAGNEELKSALDVLADFTSYFQRLNIGYKITELEVKPPQLLAGQVQDENNKPLPPPWRIFDFVVTTDINPNILFGNFNVAVTRIESIEMGIENTTKLTWVIKGKVYVKD